jgi:hypothetical protein
MNDAWQDVPLALRTVQSRPLFVMRLVVPQSVEVGITPAGARRVATVQGGTFEGFGNGLSGKVHFGGNDWITQPADGSTRLDARIVLETDGGETILMSYRGIRAGPAEVLLRLAAFEPVDPADYYFRTIPTFETGAKSLDWLNRIFAIGIGQKLPVGVAYSVFELL